jgi:protein subunit release factor A
MRINMEKLKTTEKSFFNELVDHLIPILKEFINQKNNSGESSETNASKKKEIGSGDNEDKTANFNHNRIADRL